MEEAVILEMEVFFTDGKSKCFEISENSLEVLLHRTPQSQTLSFSMEIPF